MLESLGGGRDNGSGRYPHVLNRILSSSARHYGQRVAPCSAFGPVAPPGRPRCAEAGHRDEGCQPEGGGAQALERTPGAFGVSDGGFTHF
jgi:hypothetical protein